jgi:hypothetical protein
MREWARETLRRQVRLSDPPWVRRGHTGAVLAVVEFVPDGGPGGRFPPDDRLIVKIYPPGDLAAETGSHNLATEIDPDFARRHLVSQRYSRLPLGHRKFFSCQEIAFDLSEAYPLTDVACEHQPAVAACAAELVLVQWNKAEQTSQIRKQPARNYLLGELRGALESGHGTHAWARHARILNPAPRWIRIAADNSGRVLPNPAALADETSLLGARELTFLVGLSHGDLHADNILARVPRVGAPLLRDTRLVDLAAFEQEAPLSRDLATLILSLVREVVRTPMRPGEDAKLIDFVLDPESRAVTPQIAPYIVEAVRSVYGVHRKVQAKFQDLWHPQYLLSVLAQALIHTSYDNIRPDGRWWYFRLAAHAADRFTAGRPGIPSPAAGEAAYIERPDSVPGEDVPPAEVPRAAGTPAVSYPVSVRDEFCAALGPDLTTVAELLDIPGPLPDARSLWDRAESQSLLQRLAPAASHLGRSDLAEMLTGTHDPPETARPVERSLAEKIMGVADLLVAAVGRAAAATSAGELEVLSMAPARLTAELTGLLDTVAVPDAEPRDDAEWRMEARSRYDLTRSGLNRLARLLPDSRASARTGMRRTELLIATVNTARADLAALLDLLADGRSHS